MRSFQIRPVCSNSSLNLFTPPHLNGKEGVNVQTVNQMALHSAAGSYLLNPGGECSFPSSLSKTRHETMVLTALLPFLSFFPVFTGTVGNTDCSHVYTTSGCQIRDTAAAGATYENAFNAREFLSASFSSFLSPLSSSLANRLSVFFNTPFRRRRRLGSSLVCKTNLSL